MFSSRPLNLGGKSAKSVSIRNFCCFLHIQSFTHFSQKNIESAIVLPSSCINVGNIDHDIHHVYV